MFLPLFPDHPEDGARYAPARQPQPDLAVAEPFGAQALGLYHFTFRDHRPPNALKIGAEGWRADRSHYFFFGRPSALGL